MELMSESVSSELVYADAIQAWNESQAPDLIGKTTEFYVRFYLQDSVLTKLDRATMMSGLEARSPFLDNEVVDFASRIPGSLKYRNGRGKYILRESLRGMVPDNILDRPKKGFAMPTAKWLKNWPMPMPSNAVKFNCAFVEKRFTEHQLGRRDDRLFLWCWLVLQRHLNSTIMIG